VVQKIFIIISIFFLAGGLGAWRIAVKKPEEKTRLILKYFTYLFIVYGVCSIFAFTGWYIWWGIALAFIGMGEIIFSWMRSERKKFLLLSVGIFSFSAITVLFVLGLNLFESDFILKIYTLVLCFDGFSQITGQLFGKKKLVQSISPNKTWAGFIGGSLIAGFTGYLLFANNGGMKMVLVLSGIIIFSGFTGDLLASYYKRKCGVKDYSKLLPGHGGILDRFDSFIFAIACLYTMFLADMPV
jgi:phosphatidate cytidylyltransferase